MEYKYDIALSFAGEDRDYVEEVATLLKANGIRVFYDKFEQVDLWGKDLGIHFDFIEDSRNILYRSFQRIIKIKYGQIMK